MKIRAYWDTDVFGGICLLYIQSPWIIFQDYPENGGTKILRKVGTYVPVYKVSYIIEL
jgi:hypothetical protein